MLRVEVGDITQLRVDAIVNAANERMLGGGGVDGAIHRAAGGELLEACRKIEEVAPGVRCPTGEARMTSGFQLPARYIIHTVGPVYRDGKSGEIKQLARCYENSLGLAINAGCSSLAFPCISTGVYRFPFEAAAAIAIATVKSTLDHSTAKLNVVFCCFREGDAEVYRTLLK